MTTPERIVKQTFWVAMTSGASLTLMLQLQVFCDGFLELANGDPHFDNAEDIDAVACVLLREFHKAAEVEYVKELSQMSWIQKFLSRGAIKSTAEWLDELESITEKLWKEKSNLPSVSLSS